MQRWPKETHLHTLLDYSQRSTPREINSKRKNRSYLKRVQLDVFPDLLHDLSTRDLSDSDEFAHGRRHRHRFVDTGYRHLLDWLRRRGGERGGSSLDLGGGRRHERFGEVENPRHGWRNFRVRVFRVWSFFSFFFRGERAQRGSIEWKINLDFFGGFPLLIGRWVQWRKREGSEWEVFGCSWITAYLVWKGQLESLCQGPCFF